MCRPSESVLDRPHLSSQVIHFTHLIMTGIIKTEKKGWHFRELVNDSGLDSVIMLKKTNST